MLELSTLRAAEEFLLSEESDGFLTLGWRNRIWDELPTVDYEYGPYRRTTLGLLAAEETLPKWEQIDDIPDYFFDLPWEILDYCRTVMADRIPNPATRYRGYYHFAGRIDWFQSDFQTYERVPNDDEWIVRRDMWRTYALEASILALHRAIWWRPFPEEDYDAVDIGDRLDAHAIAALDWCDDSRKASLQRAYWLHWLHDLFPKVLASIDDVRRAVSPE